MNNLKVGDKFKSLISDTEITIKEVYINAIVIHRLKQNDLITLTPNDALENLKIGSWEYTANNIQYTEEL